MTARTILNLGHSTYTDLPLSPTHPAFLLAGAAAHYPRPAFLLAGAAAHYSSLCGPVFVRWRERGGGGPGITTQHVGWQRAERILVLVILMPHMENGQGQKHPCFLYLFYIVKIIEKSLFYEQEIGFTRK